MCLALPALVVAIGDNDTAVVDLDGVRRNVSIALLEEVREGDYVIVHVGYALSKLDPEEAKRTLLLMAEGRDDGAQER